MGLRRKVALDNEVQRVQFLFLRLMASAATAFASPPLGQCCGVSLVVGL